MIADPEFKKYVEMYAKDEDLFFKDFAAAFGKVRSVFSCLSRKLSTVFIPRESRKVNTSQSIQQLTHLIRISFASQLLELGVPFAAVKPWYKIW